MGLLNDLTKNPGLLALGALAVGLFIFKDKISGGFSDFFKAADAAGNVTGLAGTLAGNLQGNLTGTPNPDDPLFGEEGLFTGGGLPTKGEEGSLFGAGQSFFDFFNNIGKGIGDFFGGLLPEAEGFKQTLPIGEQTLVTPPDVVIPVAPGIAEQAISPFMGGGISFEGGTIFETPVENLSLSQIIDMGLASSASEAANLKAIAEGFTAEETAFLNQGSQDVGGFVSGGPPQTSDPQFQGLTPEQIFLQLVGGNISNF